MSPEPSASERFWRFSLRQLLALCAVLAVLLAILAPRVQRAHQLRQAERELWDPIYAQIRAQAALQRSIIEGQGADRIRAALEAGAKPSGQFHDGSSPLHTAITLGRCEAVQVLLEQGADVEQSGRYNPAPGVFQGASSTGPPLFAAIDCNQPADTKIEMIRILLARGADIRCALHRRIVPVSLSDVDPASVDDRLCEIYDINLMDLAAFRGDGKVGDLLRAHGLPYGPREMAAFNRVEELKRAVQESPDLLHEQFKPIGLGNTVEEGQASTLLGIALIKNHRETARMLIQAGAPLDARDPAGQSPLHIAATHSGDPELIRLLIAHGAEVNAVDDRQQTPLVATRYWTGRETAKAALLEAGAK